MIVLAILGSPLKTQRLGSKCSSSFNSLGKAQLRLYGELRSIRTRKAGQNLSRDWHSSVRSFLSTGHNVWSSERCGTIEFTEAILISIRALYWSEAEDKRVVEVLKDWQ